MSQYLGCKYLNPISLLSDADFVALSSENRYAVALLNHLTTTCPILYDADQLKKMLMVDSVDLRVIGKFFIEMDVKSAEKVMKRLHRALHQNAKAPEYDDSVSAFPFTAFWAMYGKSVDKRWCEVRYRKIDEATRLKIQVHLPRYIDATPDVTFRKDPLRYLTKMAWMNEVVFQAPQFAAKPAPAMKRLDQ